MPNRGYPPKPPPPPPPAPWASEAEKRLHAFRGHVAFEVRRALQSVAPWYRRKAEIDIALEHAVRTIVGDYQLDIQLLTPKPEIRVHVDGVAAAEAIASAQRKLTKVRKKRKESP